MGWNDFTWRPPVTGPQTELSCSGVRSAHVGGIPRFQDKPEPEDMLQEHSPAAHVRRRRLDYESFVTALALARGGDLDRAEAVARGITSPGQQAQVLAELAAAATRW